jgi:hypothetical protein
MCRGNAVGFAMLVARQTQGAGMKRGLHEYRN